MQAVILSGGFGTRLAHVVKDVPKPMAPIKNKPFLEYIVTTLKKQGFDSFVFLTGYKAKIIEEHFKDLDNTIFIQEEKALGTGGAILNAYQYLEEDFFVINGDTFFDIDYSLLKEFGIDKPFSIALRYTNNVERYGLVDIDDNFKINSFIEKGDLPKNKIDGFINGGVYYINKSVLYSFYENFNNDFLSLENDVFPILLKENKLYGLPLGGCFIDIGIPNDYYLAQELIPNWCQKESRPTLFVDKDGTIIVNTEYPNGKDFQIIESTIDIIKKHYNDGYRIVMITNQAGIAKNKFNFEQMQEGLDGIKEYYKKLGIIFDDIEYCPYHKDGVIEEYSYNTLLRKPNPGMILKACEKLKIDLKNSIMLGDNKDIDNIKLPYLKCKIIAKGDK